MPDVYVSFGSNLGERRANIGKAVAQIGRLPGVAVEKISRVYESRPLGGPPQGNFLNGVLRIRTGIGPERLLAALLGIERRLGRGRVRACRNGPRTIDLDILFYGDRVINGNRLTLPHPRMQERDFVLRPLRELAPSLVHPVSGKSVETMARKRPVALLKDPSRLRLSISRLRKGGRKVGFIPTMGFLHEGHLSLIRRARRECGVVVVSIFVNPAQFGPGEDFKRYPRDIRRDRRLCGSTGTDIIFCPDARVMYPKGFATRVSVKGLTDGLCGAFRPGHFDGVTTVVAKLLNMVEPDIAYFGQKDGQQSVIVRRIVADLDMPVDVRICPTVREPDGLAMSSRNAYLTPAQRAEAPALYRSLVLARKMVRAGERRALRITGAMRRLVSSQTRARIDYISVAETKGLRDMRAVRGEVMIALAARFGKTRLIDNIVIRAR